MNAEREKALMAIVRDAERVGECFVAVFALNIRDEANEKIRAAFAKALRSDCESSDDYSVLFTAEKLSDCAGSVDNIAASAQNVDYLIRLNSLASALRLLACRLLAFDEMRKEG